MRELEGRSYQEIAEILELSVSAVETLIFRARRALREQLEEGITCHEAEFAISKQLDGRLDRKERGALRAHLRECEECAAFARSQRAQRGSLKSLALIPLPHSLSGLFGGGGGGAALGGGLAIKAAAIGASAMVATGVGYEGVKHGIWKPPPAPQAAAVHHAKKPAPAAKPLQTSASVMAPGQEARHDEKPFKAVSVKARRVHRENQGRSAAVKPERLAKPVHREVSTLPPSRVKKTKPVRAPKDPGNGKGTGRDRTPVKPRENGRPPVETPTPPPTGSGKPVR
jgi:hypothetical protein